MENIERLSNLSLEEMINLLSVEKLYATEKGNLITSVEDTKLLINSLNLDSSKLEIIKIVGTNGKGSVSSGLNEVLKNSKYKVGLYTSPHIENFTERIQINSTEILENEILEIMKFVYIEGKKLGIERCGFPLVMTVSALKYFLDNNVDIAIFEAGVGGLLDPINALVGDKAVITNVSIDHVKLLGKTIEEISTHKLGIINNNMKIVSGIENEISLSMLKNKIKETNSDLSLLFENLSYEIVGQTESNHYIINYKNTKFNKIISNLVIGMFGEHQIKNTLCILSMLDYLIEDGYEISLTEIRKGIEELKWIGRFEFLTPNIIVDGSHNYSGIVELEKTINNQLCNKNIKILCSSLNEKGFEKNLEILKRFSNDILLIEMYNSNRALGKDNLLNLECDKVKFIDDDINVILDDLLLNLKSDEILLVTGSLYLMSMVRGILIKKIKN